ncbi:uncharacterized protein BXZ73DRAFT_79920 [Epithele typhae]|uniref:uncharacterized protein n=1 Tax=Epithele typhae TaxID=378194 RepID=UPI002008AF13|nr:uncharacterized protein BXZ73DRAFT_79920 [Epithele typhae]KAH9921524.1 hypothetical protein BXZ73DRAFT_79920 [Epithele typhae]
MERRHQAFLIARVRPHGAPAGHPGNRRCIAAIHHEWCYGSLPLTATRRFIDLVRQPMNAAAVLSEIRSLEGKYGPFGNREPTIPEIPCPYTTSLFATAWTTNLEPDDRGRTYSTGFIPLEAYTGCWDDENNEGITVIDVTDPNNPDHCFMRHEAVLDAYGYLGCYADDVTDEKPKPGSDVNVLRALHKVPLIPCDHLREAWPRERFSDPPASRDQVAGNVPPSESGAGDSHTLAARKAVETGCIDDLVQLSRLPDGARHVKDAIGGFVPYPGNAMDLLEEVLRETHGKHPNFVDLSGIQLSREQILRVLSDTEVNWLDLSNNAVIVADDIVPILAAAPRTRVLNLIGCSSVEDAPLLSLVRDYPPELKTLEGILHPALLDIRRPRPNANTPRPSAFTLIDVCTMGKHCAHAFSSLALFTPAQVVQFLSDLLPVFSVKTGALGRMFAFTMGQDHTAPAAMQGGARRGPDEPWRARTVVNVPLETSGVPRDTKALWVFYFHPGAGWAFLRLTPRGGGGRTAAADEAAVERLQGLLDVKDGDRAMFPFLPNLSVDKLENQRDRRNRFFWG